MMLSSVSDCLLFVSQDLLREVIELKQTEVVVLLAEHAHSIELRGEDMDKKGICGTLLKQDQYDSPFELPSPEQGFSL